MPVDIDYDNVITFPEIEDHRRACGLRPAKKCGCKPPTVRLGPYEVPRMTVMHVGIVAGTAAITLLLGRLA